MTLVSSNTRRRVFLLLQGRKKMYSAVIVPPFSQQMKIIKRREIACSGMFAHCIRLRYHKHVPERLKKNRDIRNKKNNWPYFHSFLQRLCSSWQCWCLFCYWRYASVAVDSVVLIVYVLCPGDINELRACSPVARWCSPRLFPLCGLMCPRSAVMRSFVDVYAFLYSHMPRRMWRDDSKSLFILQSQHL